MIHRPWMPPGFAGRFDRQIGDLGLCFACVRPICKTSDPKKSLEQAGLTLDEKREMMLLLREQFPIDKLCEVLGVPRSSAYYAPRPDEDRPLLDALIEVAGQWPTYGYRRLTKQLQREDHAVNTKRVRRLMHEMGI